MLYINIYEYYEFEHVFLVRRIHVSTGTCVYWKITGRYSGNHVLYLSSLSKCMSARCPQIQSRVFIV